MKALLVVLALMAIIRPEHLIPVVLTGAAAAGLLVLVGMSFKIFKGIGQSALSLTHSDTSGRPDKG